MAHATKASVDILTQRVRSLTPFKIFGTVSSVKGMLVSCTGLTPFLNIGARCSINTRNHTELLAEVIGFQEQTALLMPFDDVAGVGVGCEVTFLSEHSHLYPDLSWVGRIVNALGISVDEKGPLMQGNIPYSLKASPPSAYGRQRVEKKIDMGVRSINSFTSCCLGQRLGIFAGSGVGKSMLISMLAKFASADVKVIGLLGERGREVQEFIQEYLGEEGLKQSVIVVATGDEPAIMRRQAAYTTMAIAEYFRDQGKEVLCLMDSVTRFAMAQREIGLAAGEPPTTKGYTPTVFAELPRLLERAGPGVVGGASITGLFTVLVDGDDHNEPIADAVRGILDGHIVLDRKIADRGRFPAVNVLRSISRTMPGCNSPAQNRLIRRARQYLTTYDDMAEMIRLGAYRKGSSQEVDEAIYFYPRIEEFLRQEPHDAFDLDTTYQQLADALEMPDWQEEPRS